MYFHALDRGPDLALIFRVHDDHEVWWVLQHEVGADDSLAHERHKVALLARVYVDHPIDASPGTDLQQVEEHHAFGARPPDHDFSVVRPEALDAPTPLGNFLSKSSAKGAVKLVRRTLWQTIWRRPTSNVGFQP